MASFTKQTLILQGEDLYTEWKQDIEIWSIHEFTPPPQKKKKHRPPTVFLSLSQNITQMCLTIGNNGQWLNRWVMSLYRQAR